MIQDISDLEVDSLLGDASKAEKKLGWKPKISFENLIKTMIDNDKKQAEKEAFMKKNSFRKN